MHKWAQRQREICERHVDNRYVRLAQPARRVGGPQERKRESLARLEVIADTFLYVNALCKVAMPGFLERFSQAGCDSRPEKSGGARPPLAAQSAISRLKVEGGWCVVLRVPATHSDEDLAVALLTALGVSVHPGHFYEFPSKGYLVVSLPALEAEFSFGVARLLAFLDQSH